MNNHPQLPWCPSESSRKVFEGLIRDGKFGQATPQSYAVWEFERARLGFLQPFPQVDYTDDSYRSAVNDSASIEQYFKLHADQQPGHLSFQDKLEKGQTVADCGCGGGALLDLVKQQTGGRTVAIEPFAGYHQSLAARGHEVHATVEAAANAGCAGSVDVALSYHVIEHVDDPLAYLGEIRRLVRPGGIAVVLTPNWDDILMKVDPRRMEPFFYRRVHNYYFTAASLAWVGQRAGWQPAGDIFYHEFGLANTLLWLRDGKPSGHTPCPGVDASADAFWRAYLERTGQANNVGVMLQNPS